MDLKEHWRKRGEGNKVKLAFDAIEESLDAFFRGKIRKRGIQISGPGGLGKNHVAAIRARVRGVRLVHADAPSVPGLIDLCQDTGGGFVLSNECNNVFNPATIESYKKALDPEQSARILVRDVHGPNKVDPFEVETRFVFLTNLDWTDLRLFNRVIRQNIAPLRDRLIIHRLPFDRFAMWEYAVYLCVAKGFLSQRGYKLPVVNEALRYFTETLWKEPNASPRRLEDIAEAITVSPRTWRAALDGCLPPEDTWITDQPVPAVPVIGHPLGRTLVAAPSGMPGTTKPELTAENATRLLREKLKGMRVRHTIFDARLTGEFVTIQARRNKQGGYDLLDPVSTDAREIVKARYPDLAS